MRNAMLFALFVLALFVLGCQPKTTTYVDVPPPSGSAPMVLPMASGLPRALPPATARSQHGFREGDAVEVEWHGDWWPAHVLEVRSDFPPTYLVHYDGYDDSWDEEIGLDRIRTLKSPD